MAADIAVVVDAADDDGVVADVVVVDRVLEDRNQIRLNLVIINFERANNR